MRIRHCTISRLLIIHAEKHIRRHVRTVICTNRVQSPELVVLSHDPSAFISLVLSTATTMPAVPSGLSQHIAHSGSPSFKSFSLPPADTVGGQTCWVSSSGNQASIINPLDESTLTCPNIPAWADQATDHPPPLTISIHPRDQDVSGQDEDSHKENVDTVSAQSMESRQDQDKPAEEPHDAEIAASPLRLSFPPSQLKQVTELLVKHRIDFRFDDDTTQEQREDSGSMSWGSIALMAMPLFLLIGFASGRKWEQSCKTISFEDFETLEIQGSKGLTAQFLNLPQALREFIQEDCGCSSPDLGNFGGPGRSLGEAGNGSWKAYYSYSEQDSIV